MLDGLNSPFEKTTREPKLSDHPGAKASRELYYSDKKVRERVEKIRKSQLGNYKRYGLTKDIDEQLGVGDIGEFVDSCLDNPKDMPRRLGELVGKFTYNATMKGFNGIFQREVLPPWEELGCDDENFKEDLSVDDKSDCDIPDLVPIEDFSVPVIPEDDLSSYTYDTSSEMELARTILLQKLDILDSTEESFQEYWRGIRENDKHSFSVQVSTELLPLQDELLLRLADKKIDSLKPLFELTTSSLLEEFAIEDRDFNVLRAALELKNLFLLPLSKLDPDLKIIDQVLVGLPKG